MVKLLIGLLLVIGASYGGLKLYLAHQISSAADKLVAAMAPMAKINYHGTTSSLGGMAGLTGITITVRSNGDYYRIGALEFKTDNLFTLLNLDSRLRQGKAPKTFGIEIQNMTMPLTAQLLDRSRGNLGLLGDLQMPIEALACGHRTRFTASDLDQMGIQEITTNLDAEIQREPARNDIRVLVRLNTPGINAAEADLRFAAANGSIKRLAATKGAPQVKALTLKYRDEGWHQRVQTFCTTQTGMTRKAYLRAHIAAVKTLLAQKGLRVSTNLLNAYRRFLMNGGSMKLSLALQNPINLQNLRMYTLQEAMDYLAPTLQVNGKIVRQLSIEHIAPTVAHHMKKKVTTVVGRTHNLRYIKIPLYKLDKYVQKQVLLTTNTARIFAGTLTSVHDRYAVVKVTKYGVRGDKIVLLSAITEAEVAVAPKKVDKAAP